MKLTTCFIFCVILTLQCYSANGHPGGFFESLSNTFKNTVDKAQSGIDNLFHPNNTEEAGTSGAEVSQETKSAETTTASTTTAASATNSETTTEKGRENFAGACLPGYSRTADGRCKPTF